MNIIDELEAEIKKLQDQIDEIRGSCSHPPLSVNKVPKSDTGNYDSSQDRYWYSCTCRLCGYQWIEDQ